MERAMWWCKKVRTLMGFQRADGEPRPRSRWRSPCRCRNILPPGTEGLRLLVAAESISALEEKIDPGARGLHECARGGGLGLCTESLGSESCVGGMAAEEVAQMEMAADANEEAGEQKKLRRRGGSAGRRTEKEYPPPLRWLSGGGDGHCIRFMKRERREGRLISTEVRIERPKVFSARREDGRLRLYRIESEGADEEHATSAVQEAAAEEKESGERWERWSGEWFGRCQEAASGDGEMPLWWNPRFVTTA